MHREREDEKFESLQRNHLKGLTMTRRNEIVVSESIVLLIL